MLAGAATHPPSRARLDTLPPTAKVRRTMMMIRHFASVFLLT